MTGRSWRRPKPAATCRAPRVNLRFSPNGAVHACCANTVHDLGRIGEQTIAEVWNGALIAELASALDHGDYSMGCQDCGMEAATGNRQQTTAVVFDRYRESAKPNWPQRLEFALSNTCNLQCLMCHGELSSAIRAQREHLPPIRSPYGDEFFDELRAYLPHVKETDFIGGEPFLARECWRVWDLMLELGTACGVHVTTNATVWNERVARYVRDLRMTVAVSIDGVRAETVEPLRVGARFDELIENRDRLLAITRETGRSFTLNFCLMSQNWQELGEFLLEADALDVAVHVIPVLHPANHSLFCLPDDEFVPVIAALTRESDQIRTRLGRNRAVWDGALAHLKGHAGRQHTGAVPVDLRRRQIVRRDDNAIHGAAAALREWSGREPIRLELRDGRVTAVDLPTWAEQPGSDLRVVDWNSQVVETVLPIVASVVAPDLAGETPDQNVSKPDGAERSVTVRVSGIPLELRLRAVEWNDGDVREGRTFVALDRLPSDLRAQATAGWLTEQQVQFLAESHADDAGTQPLVIDATNDVVVSVTIPPWASEWITADWEGVALPDLPELNARRGIETTAVTTVPEYDGVIREHITVRGPSLAAPLELDSMVLLWADQDGQHSRSLSIPRLSR